MGSRRSQANPRREQEEKEALSLTRSIDLNADLGEGAGTTRLAEDELLLGLVSSANIACGYHAGDATSMRATIRAAQRRGVTIGAHPSYPDLTGFGRRELGLDPKEIYVHVRAQVETMRALCTAEGVRLAHVKPHGALYNRAARDEKAASALTDAIRDVDDSLLLLGLAESEMMRAAAAAGVGFIPEAFVDRGYAPDLTLVPRGQPGAMVSTVDGAVKQAMQLVRTNTIAATDGQVRTLEARSLCVHGDNPEAATLLQALRRELDAAGIAVAPYHP